MSNILILFAVVWFNFNTGEVENLAIPTDTLDQCTRMEERVKESPKVLLSQCIEIGRV